MAPQNTSYPMSSAPATNKSVAPVVNQSTEVKSQSVEPIKPPAQNASYPMSVAPNMSVAPPSVQAKVPSVITAKPAIKQAQSQIADVNTKAQEVATQKASVAALTTAGQGYVAPDQATRDKVKAMSDQAVMNSYNAKLKEATTPGRETLNATPTSTTQRQNADATATQDNTVETTTGPKTIFDSFSEAMAATDAKAQAALEDYTAKSDQITNGSYPLSPDQQAQLDVIKQQYAGLIQQQTSINKSFQNGLTQAGISSGRSMYAPEMEMGNINVAIAAGASKVSDLNTQMLSDLSAAKELIKKNNMEALDKVYKNVEKTLSDRRDTIKETYEATKTALATAKTDYANMQQDIADMASVGKAPEDFTPGFFDKIDAQREKIGLTTYPGYSADLYKLQYTEAKKEIAKADLETQTKHANDMISFFDKTGTKGDITIGDNKYSYQGTNPADIASGTETDKNGNLVGWTYDKKTNTGKSYIIPGVNMNSGKWSTVKGDDGLYYAINAEDGTSHPITVTDSRQSWDSGDLATGATGPALPGSQYKGQCKALCNWGYGKGILTSDFNQNLEVLSKYQVTDFGSIKPGMTFLQAIGSKEYGHAGFVESIGTDTNGREYITVMDSNRHEDGKMQHGTKIYLDDPTLKMIADYPAPNLPKYGSGVAPKQLGQVDTPQGASEVTQADYKQYGKLAETDFNPSDETDKYAKAYLDQYLKNGAFPTMYTLGLGRSAAAGMPKMADIASRAQDLYYKASGQSLPDVTVLKGNKALVNANNKLLNTIKVQEGTILKNFQYEVERMDKYGINQNSKPINDLLLQYKDLMGDPQVAAYISGNITLKTEIASLLALKSASGSTVADKLEAAELVPKNSSVAQQKEVLKLIVREAENAHAALAQASQDLYTEIDPLETETKNPNREKRMKDEDLNKGKADAKKQYEDSVGMSVPDAQFEKIWQDYLASQ